jgi:hypothetical protein
MPIAVSASRTSSSLNGLMMAITIFIWFPILVVRGKSRLRGTGGKQTQIHPTLETKQSNAVPDSKKSG